MAQTNEQHAAVGKKRNLHLQTSQLLSPGIKIKTSLLDQLVEQKPFLPMF